MLADAVRAFYNTDIALVNSGAIRCDRIIQPVDGVPLRIGDIVDISPFGNAMAVKRVSGRVLAAAFENSVCDAHTDGRFLQVSGLCMTVDWRCREGRRVTGIIYLPKVGEPQVLNADKMYTAAMADFIASGFDGYSCFKHAETLVDAEGAMTDTSLLLEIFGATSAREKDGEIADDRNASVERAKKAIIQRWHEVDGFPVVSPSLDGRIKIANGCNL